MSRRYPRAGRATHALVWVRLTSLLPLLRLAENRLPGEGPILDGGCGHGGAAHWIARRRRLQVVGADLSARRIAAAQASRLPPNLRFLQADILDALLASDRPWSGYLFADSLLYLSPQKQSKVLRAARERAADGAALLIKDSASFPRWKRRFTQMEERAKRWVRYYGIRQTGPMTYRSIEEWRRLLLDAGWELEFAEPVHRWTPYPGWIGACRSVP